MPLQTGRSIRNANGDGRVDFFWDSPTKKKPKLAAAETSAAAVLDHRRWEELADDVLITIFERLDVSDLIAGVPFVCTSWSKAVADSSCWRMLDFRDWESISRRLSCSRSSALDFTDVLAFSIGRSKDWVDAIYFPDFADDVDFTLVTDSCPALLYFSIRDEIPKEEFCRTIGKLKLLKGMAVDETLICHDVLLQVQRCCEDFSELRVFGSGVNMEMASVICDRLPCLQKLELIDCFLRPEVILAFLDRLEKLEYLDISGEKNSGITGVVLEKASLLKVFRWDSEFQEGEFEYCSECEEDHHYQYFCQNKFEQEVMEGNANPETYVFPYDNLESTFGWSWKRRNEQLRASAVKVSIAKDLDFDEW